MAPRVIPLRRPIMAAVGIEPDMSRPVVRGRIEGISRATMRPPPRGRVRQSYRTGTSP